MKIKYHLVRNHQIIAEFAADDKVCILNKISFHSSDCVDKYIIQDENDIIEELWMDGQFDSAHQRKDGTMAVYYKYIEL